MDEFTNLADNLISSYSMKVLVPLPSGDDQKCCKLLDYVRNNSEKPMTDQVLKQLDNTENPNDIDLFLIDNGYSSQDLLDMYRNLYYGIQ